MKEKSWTFQVGSVVKNSPVNARGATDSGMIPGSGRSPRGGNGNPLQYSCLEDPMDRGARRATAHEVTRSRTRLSDGARVPTARSPWPRQNHCWPPPLPHQTHPPCGSALPLASQYFHCCFSSKLEVTEHHCLPNKLPSVMQPLWGFPR